MRIVVVGGGVTGLAFVRALQCAAQAASKCGVAATAGAAQLPQSVVLLGRAADREGAAIDRGLGIWNHAADILARLGLERWMANRPRVPSAGYRDGQSGAWLSRCSYSEDNYQRVSCVTAADLCGNLERAVRNGHGVGRQGAKGPQLDVTLDTANAVIAIGGLDGCGGSGLVHTASGSTLEADLVVGCDGVHSPVRAATAPGHSHPDTATASSGCSGRDTVPLGETCFSGIASQPSGCLPFEALGVEGRFVVVPLSATSCFWFATLPEATADGVMARRSGGGSESLLAGLEGVFGGWCDPIPNVLRASRGSGVLIEPLHRLAQPTAPTAPGSVLLGDAAHVLAPNLAQGASVGIEDAWELAVRLHHPGLGSLNDRVLAFHEARAPRHRQYRRMTAATAVTGRLQSPAVHALRCALLRLTPSAVNERVFDAALLHSLGHPYRPSDLEPPP